MQIYQNKKTHHLIILRRIHGFSLICTPKRSMNNEQKQTYNEDVEMTTNGGMYVSCTFNIEEINTDEASVTDLNYHDLMRGDGIMKLSSDGSLVTSADDIHDNMTLTDSALTVLPDISHLVLDDNSEYEMKVIEIISEAMQPSAVSEPGPDIYYSCSKNETSSGPLISGNTHVCSWCEKHFARVSTLHAHERIHKGEKPFGCAVCSKRFTQSADLMKHTRIHTGERPFGCGMCDRRFTQASNLQVHLRTHTRELPYSCSFCDRKFNLATNLQVHERIHSGERPFACYQCDMRFIQSSHLQRHIAVHRKKDRSS